MKVSMPITALALTMLAYGADSVLRPQDSSQALSEAARIDAELELSMLRLQADAATRRQSADTIRERLSVWHEENKALMKQSRDLKQLAPPPPPVADPGTAPQPAGKAAEDFLTDAADYKRKVVEFIAANLEKPGDAEEFREKVAARMGQPDIAAMDRQIQTAREGLQPAQPTAEDLPKSGEELTGLAPAELAEEEIYSAIYAATRRPLDPGEELRDRIGPLDGWIRSKREPFQKDARAHLRQEMAARIDALEAQLETSAESTDQ